MAKQSSDVLATLASRVLKGDEPTRDEIESLAASVLAQSDGAEASAAEPDLALEEQPAPGPDDVVTVTVGGKDKHGAITTEIERGAAAETHPEGSRFVPDQKSPDL